QRPCASAGPAVRSAKSSATAYICRNDMGTRVARFAARFADEVALVRRTRAASFGRRIKTMSPFVRAAFVSLLPIALAGIGEPAEARITRIQIDSRAVAFGG